VTKWTASPVQVAMMLVGFVALTAIGVWWAAPSSDAIAWRQRRTRVDCLARGWWR
jgi:hypothetical protein